MRRSFAGVRLRLGAAGAFFLVIFLAVTLRAFQLQILDGEKLRQLGEKQHLKEMIVLPKRGTILDRAGEPLALSLEGQSVYGRPRRIKEPKTAAAHLAQALALDSADIAQKLASEKSFIWLKRQVTPKEAERVEALNIDGVGIYVEPNRYYPQGQLAAQLVGFVGRDSQGLEGVEMHYDDYLRGESGSSVVERDALGRRVLVQGVETLQIPPGSDLQLTLDTSIQHLAERELDAAAAKYRAKAGVAIVVEPFTGEILALANYPFFNPNNFTRQSSNQWRNRAVTDSFEPGSTFKTILAAAALEEGVVGKEDLFFCENGKYAYAGKIIHDTHEHGWLPFAKIIQYSSNIGVTKVAEKLGKERYAKYIQNFGFGQPTGVDLPGEATGSVRRAEKWAAIDLATHAFGQGISVTPMQLVMAYGAVANGGFLMRPFVVKRAVGPDGRLLWENQPHVVRRVVSEGAAHTLTSILKGVVDEGGTGVLASVEGFEVAGKTGTAQKAEHGVYTKKRVASFVGFVPADQPRLVLAVILDEPETSVYGGTVAAPAFRNIAAATLQRLAVMPDKGAPQPSAPALHEAAASKIQHRTERASVGAEDDVNVPDFIGLSLREAVERARAMKIRVEMRGNGYVVKQSPVPGAAWGKDGTLTLNLQG
ncbi:MAG TPA: penicillin-binding protein [Verrucomicrobiae bacterium]|jgi:cell division protein FtsI (penicillin-binding protein 3)|nr:penicillin-binding protein [Verrucomicrobiae bacterium]